MGIANSHQIAGHFEEIRAWSWSRAQSTLKLYKSKGYDFGLDATAVMTLTSLSIEDSKSLIKSLTTSLGGSNGVEPERVNAITFLCAIICLSDSQNHLDSARYDAAFELLDFANVGTMESDEFSILLLCLATSMAGILGRSLSGIEDPIFSVLTQEVFKFLEKDMDCKISKEEFAFWALEYAHDIHIDKLFSKFVSPIEFDPNMPEPEPEPEEEPEPEPEEEPEAEAEAGVGGVSEAVGGEEGGGGGDQEGERGGAGGEGVGAEPAAEHTPTPTGDGGDAEEDLYEETFDDFELSQSQPKVEVEVEVEAGGVDAPSLLDSVTSIGDGAFVSNVTPAEAEAPAEGEGGGDEIDALLNDLGDLEASVGGEGEGEAAAEVEPNVADEGAGAGATAPSAVGADAAADDAGLDALLDELNMEQGEEGGN